MYQRFMPVGQPEVHVGSASCSVKHFTSNGRTAGSIGLLYVQMLPPRTELIPVIPIRVGSSADTERMMFTLCRTCADESLSTESTLMPPCQHSDKQRNFEGVYTSPEVLYAVDRGYRITNIFEVNPPPPTFVSNDL